MTAEQIAVITTSVVALTQLLKWMGMSNKMGPIIVLVLSLLAVLVFEWSQIDQAFHRSHAFNLFATWIIVATSAAGVFGFTRAGAEAITKTSSPPPGPMQTPTTPGNP